MAQNAKAETERRKLLDAYYGGAIDVPTLKGEQARIGADLTAAKDRVADLDANLSEWQEILELAATFATRCGDAYRKASDRTRRQFNAAVFTRLDVKEGRLCHEECRAPFDVPELQYGTRANQGGPESGRRESNPRSQLGKITQPEAADVSEPEWPVSESADDSEPLRTDPDAP